jgi:hypothetical protein
MWAQLNAAAAPTAEAKRSISKSGTKSRPVRIRQQRDG